jgi:periplasmic protein TonB
MSQAPPKRRGLPPAVGYAFSIVFHLAIFGWAWALPVRARRTERVDVEIVEVKPKPVEPKPPAPEPPRPSQPVKMRPARRVALNTPPPPPNTPPPETPPPETPPSPSLTPGPVRLGISLSSTSVGGGFAAPVGNSLGGKPTSRAAAPAGDDIGPVAHAAALTVQPEPIDTDIPKSEYPQAALDAGFEGSVILKIVIDASGRVRRAVVIKDPGYGLGAAAVRSALKHFRFKPGQLDGKATATEWTFTVTYELP